MTEYYSDYSLLEAYFFNKSVTSTNWDVHAVITSSLTYSSINLTFFSLMTIFIVNKKIKKKIINFACKSWILVQNFHIKIP